MTENKIKFRAWDKKNKCYHMNGQIIDLNYSIHCGQILFDNDSSFDLKKQDIKLEQFTGLELDSGVEVYEGDILDWGIWEREGGERGYIEYDSDKFSFVIHYFSKYGGEGYDNLDDFIMHRLIEFKKCSKCGSSNKSTTPLKIKVIGNINENFHLLNQCKII